MSIDTAVTYTITAPAGVDGYGEIAQLNGAPTDTHFVGYLLDSSGFDSPEIRESFDMRVEGDGATHGNFYYGQRPFTMEIVVHPASTWAASHTRLDKLMRATNAMRSDGTVVWTETGGVAKRLSFRRQQPLRFTQEGRKCLFAAVSADPRIVTSAETSTALNASISNVGNASYPPRFSITSASNPVLTNTTTGDVFSLTLSGGTTVEVDFAAHTVTQGGVNRYSSVDFDTSEWWELAPGTNAITVSGGSATMHWRSAWL